VLIFRPIKTANYMTINILTNVCVGMLIFTPKKRRIYFLYITTTITIIYIYFFFFQNIRGKINISTLKIAN
jgi:L-asparagine transporter-like permease